MIQSINNNFLKEESNNDNNSNYNKNIKKFNFDNNTNELYDHNYGINEQDLMMLYNKKLKTDTIKHNSIGVSKKNSTIVLEDNIINNAINYENLEYGFVSNNLASNKIFKDSWSPIKVPTRNKIDSYASTFIKDLSKIETNRNLNLT